MIDTFLSVSVDTSCPEPFEDRVDILFRELELATKWQRPSVLLAVYSSEYVRADADIALENRLHDLGQSAYHIKIKDKAGADIPFKIAELANLDNVVFFVEGLRWGTCGDNCYSYETLNNQREFFIENQIRVVFWLTEKEAIDLAHYAPDYWCFRHRVIEFVDSPRPAQISPNILESAWQATDDFSDSAEDLDAKIALRTALLTDLPTGNELTAARANLLLTLGVLYWRRGEFERATQLLNTALDAAARLEDNCFEALCFNAIALVHNDLGRHEEAIQAYQNAISLAPDRISAWNNLGHLFKKLGRRDEALAAFQKAIEQNGTDAMGWNGLGDLYHETGRHDESTYAYLKAIEFAPDLARSWSGLGNSYKESGRLDDALAAHHKAIEIDRRTVNSWLGLGDIYRSQGITENASMAYRTALELDPKNQQAWNELGNLYYTAGGYDEAMRCYIKSIESNQCGYLTYSNLASIYGHKGLHAQATPLLLKAIELSKNEDETVCLWNRLGDAYRRTDDYDNAIEAYRKADALASESAPILTEAPVSTEEPQISPAEGISGLQQPPLETDPVQEEPLATEDSQPVLVRAPDPLPACDESFDTAVPDLEFVNWLDGLASVLPVTPQPEPAIENDPVLPEPEPLEATAESEPEPLAQAESVEPSDLPVEVETFQQKEPVSECPEPKLISYVPFEDYASGTTGKILDSSTAEESGVVMLGDDLATTTAAKADNFSEPVSQPGEPGGEPVHQSQASIDQKNALIWNELGNIYYNAGAFDEAMHAFEMAIELDPSYGWSYNNLASIYFHQKRYAEAVPLYQKGLLFLDDFKDKALLWNRLGDAYRRLDDHAQASAAYRKAIELDSDNVSLLTRARFSLLGNLRV